MLDLEKQWGKKVNPDDYKRMSSFPENENELIFKKSLDKWVDALTVKEVLIIEKMCKPIMDKEGYKCLIS
jgi:hypothetical protein